MTQGHDAHLRCLCLFLRQNHHPLLLSTTWCPPFCYFSVLVIVDAGKGLLVKANWTSLTLHRLIHLIGRTIGVLLDCHLGIGEGMIDRKDETSCSLLQLLLVRHKTLNILLILQLSAGNCLPKEVDWACCTRWLLNLKYGMLGILLDLQVS